jgi:hypothetical protein
VLRTSFHAVAGCISASASGGSCGSGALSAGFAEGVGGNLPKSSAEVGVLEHAVLGGVGSMIGGGKFANGSVTGAFGYLFNQLAHEQPPIGVSEQEQRQVDLVADDKAVDGLFVAASLMPGGFVAAEGRVWVGYLATDSAGVVRYCGITCREAAVRWAEHMAADPAKANLYWTVVDGAKFETKLAARIWEQTQINFNGLMKNGGTLLNKINSIASKYWTKYGIPSP